MRIHCQVPCERLLRYFVPITCLAHSNAHPLPGAVRTFASILRANYVFSTLSIFLYAYTFINGAMSVRRRWCNFSSVLCMLPPARASTLPIGWCHFSCSISDFILAPFSTSCEDVSTLLFQSLLFAVLLTILEPPHQVRGVWSYAWCRPPAVRALWNGLFLQVLFRMVAFLIISMYDVIICFKY